MTEQEAINILQLNTPFVASKEANKAVEVAINALEKQIAKKLKVKKECFARAKNGRKDFVCMYFCPNCNTKVIVDYKYCHECGQKLDSEV